MPVPRRRPIGRKNRKNAPQAEPDFNTFKTLIAQESAKFVSAQEAIGHNIHSQVINHKWLEHIHSKAGVICMNAALTSVGVGRKTKKDRLLRKRMGVIAKELAIANVSRTLTKIDLIRAIKTEIVSEITKSLGQEKVAGFRVSLNNNSKKFTRAML